MEKAWLILLVTLAAVTVVILLINKFSKQTDLSELLQRVKLWWGMVFVLSLSIFISPVISIITLGFLSFFALKEFYNLNKTSKSETNIHFWAYLAIPIQFYWIYIGWYGMFIIFIPVYVFLFLPLVRILAGGTKGFVKSVATTHWGLMLMVFGLSHLAFYTQTDAHWGTKMVMYVVILTQFNDVIYYLFSKFFVNKKHYFRKHQYLSWLGLLFGLSLTTSLSYLLAPHLTPMGSLQALVAGLSISFVGFIGTLNIAYLKMDLKSSDETANASSKNEESFLSKIDSLTYTAPIFLHYIRYVSDLF